MGCWAIELQIKKGDCRSGNLLLDFSNWLGNILCVVAVRKLSIHTFCQSPPPKECYWVIDPRGTFRNVPWPVAVYRDCIFHALPRNIGDGMIWLLSLCQPGCHWISGIFHDLDRSVPFCFFWSPEFISFYSTWFELLINVMFLFANFNFKSIFLPRLCWRNGVDVNGIELFHISIGCYSCWYGKAKYGHRWLYCQSMTVLFQLCPLISQGHFCVVPMLYLS